MGTRSFVGTGSPEATGQPSRGARNGTVARTCLMIPWHRAVERSRMAFSKKILLYTTPDSATISTYEGVALEFGLVWLGLHCFLRVSSAALIVVLFPGCC